MDELPCPIPLREIQHTRHGRRRHLFCPSSLTAGVLCFVCMALYWRKRCDEQYGFDSPSGGGSGG